MMSSVISFVYFTRFSNLNISGTNTDISNGNQHFYSFMEFYVMHLKDQGVKIWLVYYHFNMYHVNFQECVFLPQERLRININRWVVMFVIGFVTGLIAFTIDILIILLADQKYTLVKKCILFLYI